MRFIYAATAATALMAGAAIQSARAVDLVTDLNPAGETETTTKSGVTYTLGLGAAFAPDYEVTRIKRLDP